MDLTDPATVIRGLAQASPPDVRATLSALAVPAPSGVQLLIRSAAAARLYELDGTLATLGCALADHAASSVFGPLRHLVTRRLVLVQAQSAMRGQEVDLHRLAGMLDMPDDPDRPGTLAALQGLVLVAGALVDAPGYDLDAALDRIRELTATLPSDHEYVQILPTFRDALLVARQQRTGEHGAGQTEEDLPGAADLNGTQWLRRELMRLASEAMTSAQRGDMATIARIIPQVEDIVEQLPPDDPGAGQIRMMIDQVKDLMGGSTKPMRVAAEQPGLSRSERAARLFLIAAAEADQAAQAQDAARLAAAKETVREVVELAPADDPQLFSYLMLLGKAETTLFQLRGQRHELIAAIGHLEAAVRAADHVSNPMWTIACMALAVAYRLDGRLGEGRQAGLRALRGGARMVLLQDTLSQATDAARHAAAEAVEVARWCLADGDGDSAARALDGGRGLLLAAARVTATVSERLALAGHDQLADRWRRRGGNFPTTASDLRHAVLAALTGPNAASADEQPVLDPPDLNEVRAALQCAGADVLVYLLPGDAHGPGTAVLVPRDKAPYHLTLPRLTVRDGGPVHRHLAALGTRDVVAAASAPERTRHWRAALNDLCDWSWSAVIGPLLRDIGGWGLGRPPRLVLVPVGELATVPWHAARVHPGHFAVQEAVFSYAPSARILCDCVWRTSVDANGGYLIVGDPTGDLPDAYDEATAIRDAYYPSATLLGAGDATPTAVLAALRRTDSLLYLACHGGLGPDGSYLKLAGGEPLNISRLVEAREHETFGLVVLTACTSGAPSGGYDEAFSIATAFLASGAATVFGSLWPVPGGATSLLMFMAHHYLNVEGLRPVDALHRAQLWMLDSGRVVPAQMPVALARRVEAIERDDIAAWAAFTHRGR